VTGDTNKIAAVLSAQQRLVFVNVLFIMGQTT
jgi:hypothetical protein